MANVIIKSEERCREEDNMLRAFDGGNQQISEKENREYAEEITARMGEIKRKVEHRT